MGQLTRFSRCWQNDLLPKLELSGIHVLRYNQLQPKQQQLLRRYFLREIFPTLTPLAFDPAHPFPHISNLSFNLAVVAKDPERGECFARVKIPNTFPRLLRIPNEDRVTESEQLGLTELAENNFVWLEEVVAANIGLLFPGLKIIAAYPFRITRDADFEVEEDEAGDLLETIEEQIDQRHFGSVVRLEIDQSTPDSIREVLVRNLNLAPYQVYTQDLPLGLSNLMELTKIERPDLKFPPFLPATPDILQKSESLFSIIRREEVLLYHP